MYLTATCCLCGRTKFWKKGEDGISYARILLPGETFYEVPICNNHANEMWYEFLLVESCIFPKLVRRKDGGMMVHTALGFKAV